LEVSHAIETALYQFTQHGKVDRIIIKKVHGLRVVLGAELQEGGAADPIWAEMEAEVSWHDGRCAVSGTVSCTLEPQGWQGVVRSLHVVESFAEAKNTLAMDGPIVLALCHGISRINGYDDAGLPQITHVHVEAANAGVAPGGGARVSWHIRGHYIHPAVWFSTIAMEVSLSQVQEAGALHADWVTVVNSLKSLTGDRAAFESIKVRTP